MMKKTIKINASVSATIATGSYQNLKPGFLIEETIEDEGKTSDNYKNDVYLKERARELYDIAYGLLKEVENNAIIERIERERADLRFVASPTSGKMLPSATSIINYDADFFVSAEDLRQYASQSQIVHAKVSHYIKTGKWVEAKELPDIWTDLLIVSKGDLKLPIETGDFPAFLKKYPIEKMECGIRGFDDKIGYCGEFDFKGLPNFEEKGIILDGKLTIFDVKRTPSKVKDGMQLSAYCNLANAKQGIVIPLNSKTEQGFSKPIIYDEKALGGYFQLFLQKRKEFKKRYGI